MSTRREYACDICEFTALEQIMVRLTDIRPLTHFLRDPKAHLARLAKSGRPEVLTVNGHARVVVQDAAAYQRMLELVESIEAEEVIRARLAELESGSAAVPAKHVLAELRTRLAKPKVQRKPRSR